MRSTCGLLKRGVLLPLICQGQYQWKLKQHDVSDVSSVCPDWASGPLLRWPSTTLHSACLHPHWAQISAHDVVVFGIDQHPYGEP